MSPEFLLTVVLGLQLSNLSIHIFTLWISNSPTLPIPPDDPPEPQEQPAPKLQEPPPLPGSCVPERRKDNVYMGDFLIEHRPGEKEEYWISHRDNVLKKSGTDFGVASFEEAVRFVKWMDPTAIVKEPGPMVFDWDGPASTLP